LGFVLALASVFVLLTTAAAYAAGYDPVGAAEAEPERTARSNSSRRMTPPNLHPRYG
jgi:hypothetical protein